MLCDVLWLMPIVTTTHTRDQTPAAALTNCQLACVMHALLLLHGHSDDARERLPWDKWVFNTEAHPLPVAGSFPDKAAMSAARQVDWAASAWSDLRKLYAQHRQ
jgi:hypothetical protein